jgi:hypothetical protein
MPSESELRGRFHDGTQPKGQIDVEAVLRRARARRRPRVVLAGAATALAVTAVVIPLSLGAFSPPATDLAAGGAGDTAAQESAPVAPETNQAFATDGGIKRAPADKMNLCEAPLAEVAPAASGLVLTVDPLAAHAGDHSVPVVVTLTNEGTEHVSATTGGAPALTLSQDGMTLWHSNGPVDMIGILVDLDPGESMRYDTTFEPVRCSVDDDLLESFRSDLPAVEPGSYQLSAAIDAMPNEPPADADSASELELGVELVTGPLTTITLK